MVSFDRPSMIKIACSVLIPFVVGCSGYDDGLKKYPVTGTVRIDGEPAQEVRVYFVKEEGGGSSNADYPVGVTAADGSFALSTNGNSDGAVAGNYVVMFEWPDFNGPGAKDRLQGKYMNPQQSEHRVTVAEQENILEFNLKGPATANRSSNQPSLDGNDRPASSR